MSNNAHRLNIEITEEQFNRLRHHLSYGMRKAVFHKIIDQIIELCDKDGMVFLAMLLEGKVQLKQTGEVKEDEREINIGSGE